MGKPATIIQALTHPDLLGASFPDRASWSKWFTILRAIFALPMTADDLATFKQLTGRERPDPKGYREAFWICGRRSGKSRIMAALACYMGCFRDWQRHLASGELAHIVLAARDRQQAQAVRGYIVGMLRESPLLSRLIVAETGEGIQLQGNVQISVQTSDYRSIRGRTVAVALLDEIGFWPSDANSASPDSEIINALKPAMLTMPGALLIGASTPYARKGILWQAYDENYGRDTETLVVQRPQPR
jgi:phage terminase large subunit-like protein